jgi:hypothetical protein
MKLEHGTYTEAIETVANTPYAFPSGGTGAVASKIYTNDIPDNTKVEFTLTDGSIISIKCYPGTILPLVTTQCNATGLIVIR